MAAWATLRWAATALGCAALTHTGEPASRSDGAQPEYETPPPRHSFLIMNPRSGGGKVEKFGLVRKARALNVDVVLLEGTGTVDVAALARAAVEGGADLLGVAGGDGTPGMVAGIAADRGIPFMVLSAGTRNNFALDLGLDGEDPAAGLAALTDGVEVRVDLGRIGERSFVNNVSFGAYAALVQTAAYRYGHTATALDLLPELLAAGDPARLSLRARTAMVTESEAVLVSNNAYASGDIAGLGRRSRLDRGVLGLLAVTLSSARDAVQLVRNRLSGLVTQATATEAVIEADVPTVPVGIDGEAVSLPTPVHCAIRPGALRVRVPRHRPGAVRWVGGGATGGG